MNTLFDLTGRTALITGGAGLLGRKHAEVIAGAGGIPIILDIDEARAKNVALEISGAIGLGLDITDASKIEAVTKKILSDYGRIDILINNAANNPKMEAKSDVAWSRLENFSEDQWNADMDIGLKGAFLCSKIVGTAMATVERGVILNISSDLGVIAPDQRLYEKEDVPEEQQNVKPVTYSVAKHGLLGLTKYLASYFGSKNIRVNALSPGGVYTQNTDPVLVHRLKKLIPMGRMANDDEYQGSVLFLCSDASSFITGQNLIVDGGRSVR